MDKTQTDDELPPLEEQSSPLVDFFKQDSAAAFILLAAAISALAIANSPLSYAYHDILNSQFAFSVGGVYELSKSIHHWINDGLMCIFFFLVGLEIKREVLVGELASFRRALLPAAAALGGMVVPALVYISINYGAASAHGWGIPMATDIAFAMGLYRTPWQSCTRCLGGLLGSLGDCGRPRGRGYHRPLLHRSPRSFSARCRLLFNRVFVLYELDRRPKLLAVRRGRHRHLVSLLQSGVHATIAGVLLAFTIPATARYRSAHFKSRMGTLVDDFAEAEEYAGHLHVSAAQQRVIRKMTRECHHVEAPLQRLEYNLHPLSVFLIMPLFAFANSGVTLPLAEIGAMLFEPVTLGIALGLLIGKPLGVALFSWIAVKIRVAELPAGVNWPQMVGVGLLAGIGFTMSLFINDLAFTAGSHGVAHAAAVTTEGAISAPDQAQRFVTEGKLGILSPVLSLASAAFCYSAP
jgi:Na+:H+ antiporter, NhaA family